jgi:hypothetical protein
MNEVGSSYTATCIPSTVPGIPKVTAVRGNAQATLSWVTKQATGAPATGYTVTATPAIDPVSPTIVATGGNVVVTGLANGTSYVFRVTATNIIGTSAAGLSKPTIPATIPDVPANVAGLYGIASAQISWDVPNNGGSAITGYTILYTAGGVTKEAKGKATPTLLKGLVNGTEYTVSVKATNVLGSSAYSDTITVTPAAVPSAPVVTGVPGSQSATLTWSAPANNGRAITEYTLTSSPALPQGSTPSPIASPLTLTNLDPTVTYNISVIARNIVGASLASKPAKVKANA